MRFAWIEEPPFNYMEDGELRGSDVELARRAFGAIGESFEPIRTEFAQLLDGLADSRWDVTTGMFITPDRLRRAAFTRPIWALRDGLLVLAANMSAIDGYRSIARSGGKLAVLRGQVQEHTALGLGVAPADMIIFNDYAEAAAAVVDGTVLAYASVEQAHRAHIDRTPNSGLACIIAGSDEKAAEEGAFACASAEVRDRLNAALADILG